MFDRQPNMKMYLAASVVLVFALNQVRDIVPVMVLHHNMIPY